MFISAENYQIAAPAVSQPSVQIEKVLEKGIGPLMEDVLLHQDNIFGVFDGATSLDGWTAKDGATGGLLAAKLASAAFSENDASLARLASRASNRIRNEQKVQGIDISERHRLWSTSIAVVRLEEDSFSWCQLGDSMVLVVYRDGSYRMVCPEFDHDVETLAMWQEHENPAGLPIRELLSEQLIKVREGMNRTYGVLNGEPAALDFLNHGREPLTDVASILLFTDGLFLPKADPRADNDWCNFVEIYGREGLSALHSHVRNLQNIDPSCYLFPRFKKHDDIAAIAVNL